MAKYDIIWSAIKQNGSVTLAIPIGIQARVIKGVIHAKDDDYAYKLELIEKKKWAKLSYVKESARVTITLSIYLQTKNLALEDL